MPARSIRIVVPTWTVDASKGGIKTYLTEVLRGLARREDTELTLICSRSSRSVFDALENDSSVRLEVLDRAARPTLRPIWEQLRPVAMLQRHGQVLFTPSNVGILRARIPQVVVVQSPLAVPSIRADYAHLMRQSALHRAYFRAMLGPSLRRVDAVIAVSTWLRSELLRSVAGLDPERVHAVPEGVGHPPDGPMIAKASPPVILFVSTLFGYKGASDLVEALGILAEHMPRVAWSARFVGKDPSGGVESARLAQRANELDVGDRVTLVGPLRHDEVWNAYATATVFVYPSRLETFGLPPLEAMASGVPVIASNAPSVRSVVAGAAITVDPQDHRALAEQLCELLTSPARRAALVKAGYRRASELSWDNAAAQIRDVVARVAH